MSIRYGSACSGIEAASVAWEPMGWQPAWFSEIEPFPAAVLAHHWPTVDNLGDMLALPGRVASGEIEAPDVLVGGTPCQAFSVAGVRRGLEDERGQLTIKYVELANAIDEQRRSAGQQPCVIVWENVPGVLSSKDNAFGSFLGLLSGESCALESPRGKWANAGYVHGPQRSIAWRVLDAQYFGVAQRRRRVFVVASARKGFDPAKILFESEGVRRNHQPRRPQGKDFAHDLVGCLTASGRGVERVGDTRGQDPVVAQPFDMTAFGQYGSGETASTCKARDYKDATDLVVHGTQDPCISINKAFALGRNNGQENAALTTKPLAVRRLTPVECERLQGFPDGHTLVEYRKKPAADSNRYKAIGNSMAVPCMAWIGRRIAGELAK